MTTQLSPAPIQRFVSNNGTALSGGKVFTYLAGTMTKLATYTDSTGGTPNTNPIILNSRGEAPIWLDQTKLYKFILSPSTDTDPPTNAIWTVDQITPGSISQLAWPTGAAQVGTSSGGTVQTDLNARPTSAVLAASSGASLIGYLNAAISAVATTVGGWLGLQPLSPFDFMTVAQIADVQARTKTLDVTVPMRAWAAAVQLAGGVGRIPDGAYKLTKEVTITGRVSLTYGSVELDFSSAAASGDFPDGAGFYLKGGSLTALPALSADVAEGASAFTLASTATFLEGDVVLLHNPTTFSYSLWRSNYKAGEFIPVPASVGTAITRFGQFFAAYVAAAVNLYLMPRVSCELTGGNLKVIGPTAFTAVAGLQLEAYRKVRLLNVEGGDCAYASVYLSRCHDVKGYGLSSKQVTDGADGTQYGWIVGNCQKVYLNGNFYGRRHAVTTGGDAAVGCVPNRELIIEGQFSNHDSALPGICAANFHGNTEYSEFRGTFNGGINPAGDRNKYVGTIYTHASQNGNAIFASEWVGWSHDFSQAKVYAKGNPGASGYVVDIAGATSPTTANTTRGGITRMPSQINAPEAVNCIAARNQGSNPSTRIIIDLRGTVINELAAAPRLGLLCTTQSGRAIDRLLLRDFYLPEVTYSAAQYSIGNSAASSTLNGAITAGGSTMTLVAGGTPPVGVTVTIAAGGGTLETQVVQSVAGQVVTFVGTLGFNHADATAVTWSTPVPMNGWECSGSLSITTSNASSVATGAVVFARSAPKAPFVTTNTDTQVIGTATLISNALSRTITGFTASIHTTATTLTNFSSNTAVTVGWNAKIDD